MQLSDQLDNILDIVGVVVPVASLLAGRLNQQIRDAKEAGDPTSSASASSDPTAREGNL